ncbi:aminotransferase class V-fold PLP-dependent enzyme [Patescibacteria group bacterium]
MKLSQNIREEFPFYENNAGTIYLDWAATSLTIGSVIREMRDYYEKNPVNVHRGIYTLAEKATGEFEQTRREVAEFINASSHDEIVFTSGTTEALNIVANGLCQDLSEGDEIVTTVAEHHANLVPWQAKAKEAGAVMKYVDVTEEGYLRFGENDDGKTSKFAEEAGVPVGSLEEMITDKTKVLAIQYVSNTLGTVHPLKDIIEYVRGKNPGIKIVVDAAQAVPHFKVDVYELDCDFLAFSGHKIYGPKGVGVLWGRKALLDKLPPYKYGGEMIDSVQLSGTTYNSAPERFEAGSPNIASVIGLKQAIWFLQDLGYKNLQKHERKLLEKIYKELEGTFGKDIQILGPVDVKDRVGVVAFSIRGMHPHDIAQILDEQGIAIRAGHHCTEPLHTRFGSKATARVSVSACSTEEDIAKFMLGMKKVKEKLG